MSKKEAPNWGFSLYPRVHFCYTMYIMIKTNIKTVQSLSRKEKKANKKLYNKKVRKMSV